MKTHAFAVFGLFLIACSEPASLATTGPRFRSTSPRHVIQLPAPEAVLPSAFTAVMGGTNNNFPHAAFRNMRFQQVFLGSDLVSPQIVSLCLRRDDQIGSLSRTKTLTIKLGPTNLDNTNLGVVFDENYSAPPTEVFSGDVVIPAAAAGGTPADFDFCIPFTQQYDHPAGSNLIVDVINTSLDLRDAPRDACLGSESGCMTRRVYAFSPTATTATVNEAGGLVIKLVSPLPPAPVDPANADECRNGGWSDFNFRNQGQCIRFVETGFDSRT
jgi:hypothetical protein